MYRAACAAKSIVGKPNSFERNVGVNIRLLAFRIELQIIKTMLLNVMQRETTLLFGRTDTASCLYMLGSQFPQLARKRAGDQQNQQECKGSLLHKIHLLSVSFRGQG